MLQSGIGEVSANDAVMELLIIIVRTSTTVRSLHLDGHPGLLASLPDGWLTALALPCPAPRSQNACKTASAQRVIAVLPYFP